MQIPNLAFPAQPSAALDMLWAVNLLAVALCTLILFRQRGRGISSDLVDAARLDGCGFWRMYWHVTLPKVMRPALGVIGVLVLAAACDDMLAPLIGGSGGIPALLMAGLLILVPPVIAMLLPVRRHGTG